MKLYIVIMRQPYGMYGPIVKTEEIGSGQGIGIFSDENGSPTIGDYDRIDPDTGMRIVGKYCVVDDKRKIKEAIDTLRKAMSGEAVATKREKEEESNDRKLSFLAPDSISPIAGDKREVKDIFIGMVADNDLGDGSGYQCLIAMKVTEIPPTDKCPKSMFRLNMTDPATGSIRMTSEIKRMCKSTEKCPIENADYAIIETNGSYYSHVILADRISHPVEETISKIFPKLLKGLQKDRRFIFSDKVEKEPPHIV